MCTYNIMKANLRDLIAHTGLVILLKSDSSRQFFSLCDHKIWWMTSKNNSHLFFTTSSFMRHFKAIGELKLVLQSGNAQFGSKLAIFLSRGTLIFGGWPWKTIGHLFFTTLSFVHDFKTTGEFELELLSGNAHFGSKSAIFVPCDLEIRQMTPKNNRTPLLCYFKLCASFLSHHWIQIGITVRKRPIWVKIDDFISHVTLEFDGLSWKQ